MRRRCRTRLALKWVGLVGCVATILMAAASWEWSADIAWWTGADLWHVGTIPGNLHCGVWSDAKDDPQFRRVEGGVDISAVPTQMKDPAFLFTGPRMTHTCALPAEGTTVMLPMWLVLLVLAIPTALLWYRDRRPPKGHCQKCGYNLKGNESGVCPECGGPA